MDECSGGLERPGWSWSCGSKFGELAKDESRAGRCDDANLFEGLECDDSSMSGQAASSTGGSHGEKKGMERILERSKLGMEVISTF